MSAAASVPDEPISYNAVPLPSSLGAATTAATDESANATEGAAAVPQTAAQQRLAALKSRLADARSKNHKAVVAEDRRNKLGDTGLKAERQQKAYEKKQQHAAEGGAPTEAALMMEVTASDAYDKQQKASKKDKRRGEYGWDVYNNEAQYRHHKKQMRRAETDGRAASSSELVDEGDPDPLAYGQAPPVPKERVQALVEDMHEAALRRASWSRRRTFNEESNVTYINKRNEVCAPAAANCLRVPVRRSGWPCGGGMGHHRAQSSPFPSLPWPLPPSPPLLPLAPPTGPTSRVPDTRPSPAWLSVPGVQQEDRACLRPVHRRDTRQPRAGHGIVSTCRAWIDAYTSRCCTKPHPPPPQQFQVGNWPLNMQLNRPWNRGRVACPTWLRVARGGQDAGATSASAVRVGAARLRRFPHLPFPSSISLPAPPHPTRIHSLCL